VHRDLKPNNIMFANESINSLKILDFGLSAKNNHIGEMDDKVGTVIYMAPELAGHRNYTK